MKNLIHALRKKESDRGFTLVEILVAMSVFLIALAGVQATVSAGLQQIKDAQVNRGAAECARIIMEYLSTVPADAIYKQSADSGGNPILSASGGIPPLDNFMNGVSGSECLRLSTNPKVQLTYSICPGCVAYTYNDASVGLYTTCDYSLQATVNYRGLIYKRSRSITYEKKFFGKNTGKCEDMCGVGGSPPVGQWAHKINKCNASL